MQTLLKIQQIELHRAPADPSNPTVSAAELVEHLKERRHAKQQRANKIRQVSPNPIPNPNPNPDPDPDPDPDPNLTLTLTLTLTLFRYLSPRTAPSASPWRRVLGLALAALRLVLRLRVVLWLVLQLVLRLVRLSAPAEG